MVGSGSRSRGFSSSASLGMRPQTPAGHIPREWGCSVGPKRRSRDHDGLEGTRIPGDVARCSRRDPKWNCIPWDGEGSSTHPFRGIGIPKEQREKADPTSQRDRNSHPNRDPWDAGRALGKQGGTPDPDWIPAGSPFPLPWNILVSALTRSRRWPLPPPLWELKGKSHYPSFPPARDHPEQENREGSSCSGHRLSSVPRGSGVIQCSAFPGF